MAGRKELWPLAECATCLGEPFVSGADGNAVLVLHLPALLQSQGMAELTHPSHQGLEGVCVSETKIECLLFITARGQDIPWRKMAPGLQFVIFKSGSWSNHLLFNKRALHHMAKLFF